MLIKFPKIIVNSDYIKYVLKNEDNKIIMHFSIEHPEEINQVELSNFESVDQFWEWLKKEEHNKLFVNKLEEMIG